MRIKEYIIKNNLITNSGYNKLVKFPAGGEKLIVDKWLDDHSNVKFFIEQWIWSLTPFVDNKKYPNCIFFMNRKGKYVFEFDSNTERLFIRYDNFWSQLLKTYSMKNCDIGIVLKCMVLKDVKLKKKHSIIKILKNI